MSDPGARLARRSIDERRAPGSAAEQFAERFRAAGQQR
jgi:hypothetical protein